MNDAQAKKQFLVVGAGAWGTALAVRLAKKNPHLAITLWGRDLKELEQQRVHPLFPSVRLPDTISFSSLGQINARCYDGIIVALPSEALSVLSRLLTEVSSQTQIISVVKGFEPSTLMTPLQYCGSLFSSPERLVVLSGPSFAKDIVMGLPASVVAASSSEQSAQLVAQLFSDETLRVYTSTDPIGVEIGGATKNVIAVAAGISAGLALGDSARSALITRGLAEMMRIAEKFGAKDVKTLSGLSGLGDLIMTASSTLSRNFRAGMLLGEGHTTAQAKQIIGSTIEGFSTALLVEKIAAHKGVSMAITPVVAKIIRGEISALHAVKELLARPLKSEF